MNARVGAGGASTWQAPSPMTDTDVAPDDSRPTTTPSPAPAPTPRRSGRSRSSSPASAGPTTPDHAWATRPTRPSTDVRRVLDRQRELGVPLAFEWVDETTPGLEAVAPSGRPPRRALPAPGARGRAARSGRHRADARSGRDAATWRCPAPRSRWASRPVGRPAAVEGIEARDAALGTGFAVVDDEARAAARGRADHRAAACYASEQPGLGPVGGGRTVAGRRGHRDRGGRRAPGLPQTRPGGGGHVRARPGCARPRRDHRVLLGPDRGRRPHLRTDRLPPGRDRVHRLGACATDDRSRLDRPRPERTLWAAAEAGNRRNARLPGGSRT